MMLVDKTDRYCVVGAGSSGLIAAKNLREEGLLVDVVEREKDLGGNWNYAMPCSRVYRSTHVITSKRCMEIPDFPMPRAFPDYPHHSQILQYLRSYADRFDLIPLIEFDTPVESIEPFENGALWDVTVAGDVRRYRGVIIANGHNWSPKWPTYPGEFCGEKMHSAQYKTPERLAGKRVLVVGAGNSGCDVAVEAAQNDARVFHSTRRGYHYFPKFLFGRPGDRRGDKLLRLRLPLAIRRWITTKVLKLVVGAPEKHGLPKPDHKLFETHPLVNSLLPYYVRHGDVFPKPDVERFDGRRVHFVDGTAEEIDVAVFATGYRIVFPFIDKKWLNWHDDKPRLYKNVFHPKFDNLFVAGLIQPDGGQFVLVHWQTKAIACFLRAQRNNASAADKFRREKKHQVDASLTNGIRYKEATRHLVQVEHWSYRKGLEKIVRRLEKSMRRAA